MLIMLRPVEKIDIYVFQSGFQWFWSASHAHFEIQGAGLESTEESTEKKPDNFLDNNLL